MNFDQNLSVLHQKVALKKQLEAKQKALSGQRRIFDEKVRNLRSSYAAEQDDVVQLEGRSLTKAFYQLFGKLDEKLTEERRQAAAAKVKLEAAQRELSLVDCDLEEIQSQLHDLFGCEEAYADALQQKRNTVKASSSPAAGQILEAEEQIALLENKKKEILEATTAGSRALDTVKQILSELEDADGWNTWDMIGGGGSIIGHSIKHSHLDQAQELVELLQHQLRQYQTELADIDIHADIQVSIDGMLRFADFFFDNIFVDMSVGQEISDSHDTVLKVQKQIRISQVNLETMYKDADTQIAALHSQIEHLLLQV